MCTHAPLHQSTMAPCMPDASQHRNVSDFSEYSQPKVQESNRAMFRTSTLRSEVFEEILEDSFDEIDLSDENPKNTRQEIQEPFKFQHIINKRGRPKRAREGAPSTPKSKKKKTTPSFLDEVFDFLPKKKPALDLEPVKKKRGPKPGPRGPYKKKSHVESDSVNSSQRSYTRGPYKKRPKQDAIGQKKTKLRGPIRAPHTMEALQRDYPEMCEESRARESDQLGTYEQLEISDETGNSDKSGDSDQMAERCYTCGFKLKRKTTKAGEKVIRCMRCNQSDIHESCYENCRNCEDLGLLD